MEPSKKLTEYEKERLLKEQDNKIFQIGRCNVQILHYKEQIKDFFAELKEIQKRLWG